MDIRDGLRFLPCPRECRVPLSLMPDDPHQGFHPDQWALVPSLRIFPPLLPETLSPGSFPKYFLRNLSQASPRLPAPRLVWNKVTCVAPVACLALSSSSKFSLLVRAGHQQHAHKNPQNRQNQTIRHCTRRSNHSPAFHVHFFSLKGTYNILETFFNLHFFLKGNIFLSYFFIVVESLCLLASGEQIDSSSIYGVSLRDTFVPEFLS